MPEARVPPFSIEAEQSVLGGLLVDPEAFARIGRRPAVSDFYEPRHREIYKAIIDLDKKNLPFDLVTVATEMSKMALNYEYKAYLMELMAACPTSANIKYYADIVIEKALLRNIISMTDEIKKQAFEPNSKGDELLSLTERKVLDLSATKMQSVQEIKDIADQLINNLVAGRDRPVQLSGLSYGLDTMNKLTGGLRKGELILIAGRPGMGKTTFCLHLASHLAFREQKKVLFFSFEMSAQTLMNRILSSECNIRAEKIRDGLVSDEELPRVVEFISKMQNLNTLKIVDDWRLNSTDIQTIIRGQFLKSKVDLVVIDYIGKIQREKGLSEYEAISKLSNELKIIAGEFDIPVFCAAQLNRESDKNKYDPTPSNADLRGSGSLEQDSDMILLLHPPIMKVAKTDTWSVKEEDVRMKALSQVIMRISKNRNGRIGTIPLIFDRQHMSFQDWDGKGIDITKEE